MLHFDVRKGILVLFDGYSDSDGEVWIQDGVDDWDLEENVKARERASAAVADAAAAGHE